MEMEIVLNIGTNEVVSNLGVFTTDNASTNDVAIRVIMKRLT
jgi:hypothetical protein